MSSSEAESVSDDPEESPAWDGQDRRSGDRREAPTRPWTGWITPLRREGGRREIDQSSYVDRYTPQDVILLVSILLLNVADAFFTMRWLNHGGREANPVMDFFLDIGPGAFLVQKCLIVGMWLLILLVHKNFRFARMGLYASLAVYLVLLIVHFGIVFFNVRPPTGDAFAQTGAAYSAEALRPGPSEYSFELPPVGRIPADRLKRAGRSVAE